MPDRLNVLASGPSLILRAGFAYLGTLSEEYASESPSTVLRLSAQHQQSSDTFFFSAEVGLRYVFVLGVAASWLIFSASGRSLLKRPWKYITLSGLVTRERLWNAREYAESRRTNREIPFEYRRLNPSKAEIRLLRILPGRDDDDICVNIIHASLRDDPEYVALSYTWGPPTPRYSISLNGYDFSVGTNLGNALSQIRRGRGASQVHLCWIDALCINQADEAEVSEQVRMMSRIYEQATTVIAWLGLPTPETEVAFAMMHAIEARFQQQTRTSRSRENSTMINSLESEQSKKEWDAVARLFDNPYFTRVWVAQEITNPSKHNVEFIGGRDMQRFSLQGTVRTAYYIAAILMRPTIADAPSAICRSIRSVYNAGRVLHRFRQMEILRHRLKPGVPSLIRFMLGSRLPLGLTRFRRSLWQHEILPLLDDFRSLQATDPRDKVFAVFSILKSYVPDNSINYYLSTKEVYKQVVRDAIEGTKSLDVLSYCGGISDDLPSWVPDWRYQNNAQLLCASYSAERRHVYSGTHGSPRVNFNRDEMTVQGIIVDRVKLCSELSGPFRDECHSDWGEIALQLQDAITDREIMAIYRRTLLADCIKLQSWNILDSTRRNWIDTIKEKWYILIDAIFDSSPDEESLGLVSQLDGHMFRALSGRRLRSVFQRIPRTSTNPAYTSIAALHQSDEFKGDADDMAEITTGRRLCVTDGQTLGLVPEETWAGDVIAVLAGAQMPFVLRRVIGRYGNENENGDENGGDDGEGEGDGDGARYKVIGESYIHGLMDGEGWRGFDNGMVEMQSIVLV